MNDKLTPAQIENWRNVLFGMLGPYALIMSEDKIHQFRDKYQREADNLEESLAEKEAPVSIVGADGRCQHKVNARFCKVCKK